MKICDVENCVNPQFGGGFCKWHQHKRTDKKVKKTIIHNQRKKTRDFGFGFDNQPDLFNWLWQEAQNEKGEVICKFTGEKLNRFYNTETWFNCFSHILNKKNYTYFKLNPKNIRIVFPEFHRIIDQGTALEKANHPNWKFADWDNEVEAMKITYQEFKKTNLLA